MKYNGKCHCGQIAFEGEGNLESATECNCSICWQSGYLHWMIDDAAHENPAGKGDALSLGNWSGASLLLSEVRRRSVAEPAKHGQRPRLEGVDLTKFKLLQFDGRNMLKI
jgi:hypothetical protein